MSGPPCPLCRVPLNSVRFREVTLWMCDQCSGVWLNRDAIDEIQTLTDGDFEKLEDLQHDEAVQLREPVAGRLCPDDLSPLLVQQHPFFAAIQVDVCQQCGGVWIDDDEVSKIADIIAARRRQPHVPHASEIAMQQAAIMEVGHIEEMDRIGRMHGVFNVLRHRFLWPGL
ncbi:MAG: zf-TFIIB domain-containing protein [Fimbriimonadaceae bacterium]|nr:zf-TFIIB domain-containing protein [Fimbriimonadaceae bacterium]